MCRISDMHEEAHVYGGDVADRRPTGSFCKVLASHETLKLLQRGWGMGKGSQ